MTPLENKLEDSLEQHATSLQPNELYQLDATCSKQALGTLHDSVIPTACGLTSIASAVHRWMLHVKDCRRRVLLGGERPQERCESAE